MELLPFWTKKLSPFTHVLKILEENHYYPFGLKHGSYNSGKQKIKEETEIDPKRIVMTPNSGYMYRFNGKEWQDELGLNLYDFEARNYDPAIGRTHTLDPHAENYYHLSSYSFLNNNPILFIDPDGKDFIISYIDKDGKNREHRFNGGSNVLPDNKYVQDFVAAYRYNIENGGGASMQAIATNSDATVYVEYGEFNGQDNGKPGMNVANVITWNNEMGLETTNGYVLSPATGIEHESAHALNAINNNGEKYALSTTGDKQYDSKEERRVIQGSEQTTARANGEIPLLGVTRNDHNGRPVVTESATSNKVNVSKTQKWIKSYNSRGIYAKGKYKNNF